jgi:hypothetical protein
LRFSFFHFPLLNSLLNDREPAGYGDGGELPMRRTDLAEATLQGWARLNPSQRQRFFEAFVKAAVRLDRLELRAWLRRRLKNPPLAESIDPARFAISDADIALLMRAAREAPGEARTDRDDADGG